MSDTQNTKFIVDPANSCPIKQDSNSNAFHTGTRVHNDNNSDVAHNEDKSKQGFLNFCEKFNFAGFSFPKIVVNENGGKHPVGIPSWKNIKQSNWKTFVKKQHSAFGIVTGEVSNVTVIDCDTPESYKAIIADYPELSDTLTVKTPKGFHIYCKYESGIRSDTNCFSRYPHVDMRNDARILFAPPTTYNAALECASHYSIHCESADPLKHFADFPQSLKQELRQFN